MAKKKERELNPIPARKIFRWIDRRMTYCDLTERRLLQDLKGWVELWENDEQIKKKK